MSHHFKHAHPELTPPFQQYVAELEPLVAMTAPEVRGDRAFLGWLCELLPSRTCSAQELTDADRAWLAALEYVAHRHEIDYELVTRTGAEDAIWLIPLRGNVLTQLNQDMRLRFPYYLRGQIRRSTRALV